MREHREERRAFCSRRRFLGGFILIILGVGFLLHNLYPWFRTDYIFPLLIITIGIYLLAGGKV